MFCQCRDILVRFGRTVALDVKRLTVPAGKITAVLGGNGAGKTTLLEVLALLRRPSRGEIYLWGQPARRGDRELQRKVVLVSHPGYLFRGSVLSNVAYGLRARGVGRKIAAAGATEALEKVGLAALAPRRASHLSAGQRQRVNLARAIAIAPAAILLDEPTANVDAPSVTVILDLLRGLRDEQGTTVIYASPAENGLGDMTDHVVQLADGRVVGDG